MRVTIFFGALLLCAIHLARASETSGVVTLDRSKLPTRLVKEPTYKGRAGYLLLALGREAKHAAWLVLDGDTLYVDRRGDGDLTRPDCRVVGKTVNYAERAFEAGDLSVGGETYKKLQLVIDPAKSMAGADSPETGFYSEFLSRHPDGKLYVVSLEVPLPKPFPDLRDKSPLTKVAQIAGHYDKNGLLQFAPRPAEAPVIHFGGLWTFWPYGKQRLLRGRSEELMFHLGTPGIRPGTFAALRYDFLVPETAKPRLIIEYASEQGDRTIKQDCLIEDRC